MSADYMERVYRRVCRDLGLRVAWTKSGRHFTGRTIHLWSEYRLTMTPTEVQEELRGNLAHEIGHWLAASPEQRTQPNWGLGHSYSDVENGATQVPTVGLATADRCEVMASALGLLLRHRVEGDSDAVYADFQEQSWRFVSWMEALRRFLKDGTVLWSGDLLWPAELLDRCSWLPEACAELRAR